jgi:hypothetical protein
MELRPVRLGAREAIRQNASGALSLVIACVSFLVVGCRLSGGTAADSIAMGMERFFGFVFASTLIAGLSMPALGSDPPRAPPGTRAAEP